MAKNSSQAITGNNTFNQGFYLINEEKDFRSLPLGINICATKDSIKILNLSADYITVPVGTYLTFVIKGTEEMSNGLIVMLLGFSTGNFNLVKFPSSSSFIVLKSW